MSSINRSTKPAPIFTHEGTRAERITPLQQLVRSVMSCMLWEDGFYEDGEKIADRIGRLVHAVSLHEAAGVALEARNNMKLRHVPLLVCRYMANHPKRTDAAGNNHTSWVSAAISEVIQRPDELSEFLALYWATNPGGKKTLSKQVKLGLAKAFAKFDEYALAKYNREKDVMLRDVLFLCHSKPADSPQDVLGKWDRRARKDLRDGNGSFRTHFSEGELLYGKLIYDQLQVPDTWEVELSQSKDKHGSWARLLNENKLGDLAFLRNLRNMLQAGIPIHEIRRAAESRAWGRVLPFRFISAAGQVPQLEPYLEQWMFKCLAGQRKLSGRTAIVIDTSPSMWGAKVSAKSDLTRFDAAAALAMLVRELSDDCHIYSFNEVATKVIPRRGFALRDVLAASRGNYSAGGLGVKMANAEGYDRIIVLTDGQWHCDDGRRVCHGPMAVAKKAIPAPLTEKAYLIDVSGNENGIGYANWLHIDGFSEAVIDYIVAYEGAQ